MKKSFHTRNNANLRFKDMSLLFDWQHKASWYDGLFPRTFIESLKKFKHLILAVIKSESIKNIKITFQICTRIHVIVNIIVIIDFHKFGISLNLIVF